ncbi:uncharacterized [Tachysurus ichikawai]
MSPFEECTSQYSGEEQQGSTHNAVRRRRSPPTSSLTVRERSSEVKWRARKPCSRNINSGYYLRFSFLLLGRTAIKCSGVYLETK